MMKCLTNLDYAIHVIDRTATLLNSIAQHMSTRSTERGKTLRVSICTLDMDNEEARMHNATFRDGVEDYIFFETGIRFRSHSKSKSSSDPAIEHIVKEHFTDSYIAGAIGRKVKVHRCHFVPGIYEYRYSSTGKYRKWFKVG